jgi:hypothetical protein
MRKERTEKPNRQRIENYYSEIRIETICKTMCYVIYSE